MNIYDIETKIEKLPDNLIVEINDYIDFLLNKYNIEERVEKKFTFDWEGDLNKLKNRYSSVELQHKSLEWR